VESGGPKFADDPAGADRHPVLRGFEETDLISFGSELQRLRIDSGAVDIRASQSAGDWNRSRRMVDPQPETDTAGLVLNCASNSRVAYLQLKHRERRAQVDQSRQQPIG
jgi:hypothetical protein